VEITSKEDAFCLDGVDEAIAEEMMRATVTANCRYPPDDAYDEDKDKDKDKDKGEFPKKWSEAWMVLVGMYNIGGRGSTSEIERVVADIAKRSPQMVFSGNIATIVEELRSKGQARNSSKGVALTPEGVEIAGAIVKSLKEKAGQRHQSPSPSPSPPRSQTELCSNERQEDRPALSSSGAGSPVRDQIQGKRKLIDMVASDTETPRSPFSGHDGGAFVKSGTQRQTPIWTKQHSSAAKLERDEVSFPEAVGRSSSGAAPVDIRLPFESSHASSWRDPAPALPDSQVGEPDHMSGDDDGDYDHEYYEDLRSAGYERGLDVEGDTKAATDNFDANRLLTYDSDSKVSKFVINLTQSDDGSLDTSDVEKCFSATDNLNDTGSRNSCGSMDAGTECGEIAWGSCTTTTTTAIATSAPATSAPGDPTKPAVSLPSSSGMSSLLSRLKKAATRKQDLELPNATVLGHSQPQPSQTSNHRSNHGNRDGDGSSEPGLQKKRNPQKRRNQSREQNENAQPCASILNAHPSSHTERNGVVGVVSAAGAAGAAAGGTAGAARKASGARICIPSAQRQRWEVVLLVDTREKDSAYIQAACMGAGIPCAIMMLALGDFLWAARPRKSGKPTTRTIDSYYTRMRTEDAGDAGDAMEPIGYGDDDSMGPEEAADTSMSMVMTSVTMRDVLGWVVLPCIAERKTIVDLCGSIVDSRYQEQRMRIRDCELHCKLYIVEGLELTASSAGQDGHAAAGNNRPNNANPRSYWAAKKHNDTNNRGLNPRQPGGNGGPVSTKALRASLVSTQLAFGITVCRTRGLDHTTPFLEYLHERISKEFYEGGDDGDNVVNQVNASPLANNDFESLVDFHKRCGRKQVETAEDLFVHQLRQIPGVSVPAAVAIAERFGTFSQFCRRVFDDNDDNGKWDAIRGEIAGLRKGGSTGQKIGPKVAETVCKVFSQEY
jgi:ERCC4-type nuclease